MFRMLVPLNGSILADWCLAWVDELAASLQAEVELLRVVKKRTDLADEEVPVLDHAASEVNLPVSGLARAAQRLRRATNVRTHIVEGAPASEIVARARVWPADMVLMTSHGRRGLHRSLLGSVASTVIRESGVPVLVVRGDLAAARPRIPRRVLVPLDGSPLAACVLPHVTRLARDLGATMILLAVVDLSEPWPPGATSVTTVMQPVADRRARAQGYIDKVASDVRSKGVSVDTVVRVGLAGDTILEVAPIARADLVAMSTHGRSGLNRLAVGSVTEVVLTHADVPLLALRPLAPPSTDTAGGSP